MRSAPLIVITVAAHDAHLDPARIALVNERYADGIRRAGGLPLLVSANASETQRATAFAEMDGLLLSGGADIDPARYGQPLAGSEGIEPGRDALEAAAWAAAAERDLPVLGVCRGLQAINVFSGGTLLQHVEGHAGAGWGHGPAATHPIRLVPGARLTRILSPAKALASLEVNSYHHQGIRTSDLAPGLVPTAWATSPAGDLVEALEATGGRFVAGIQCHPERTESTPEAFERLFAFFVDACRGPVR